MRYRMKSRTASLCLLLALSLPACKQSGGSSSTTGGLQVSLADAASDQIDRFEVDVVSIDLLKANGAVVHTLPLTTRVDFAELTQVSELVNAVSIPTGAYQEVDMVLDFSAKSTRVVR